MAEEARRKPKPACSVIIPSYCSSLTIRACLASLLGQDFEHGYEIIVVDSSPDDTAGIVLREFPQVELIRLRQRSDPALARNTGAQWARGEVLAFIDSDCTAGPDWLKRLYETIKGGYDAAGGAIANGNGYSLVSWAGYLCEFREFLPGGKPRDVDNLTLGNAAYTAKAFWETGGFPAGCFPQEDQVFHHRFRQIGRRIRFDPGVVVMHRHRTELGEYLSHQRKIGEANAGVVRRLELPGKFLARHARLARLAMPALVALRFIRTCLASWRAENMLLLRRPRLAWLCLLGTYRWGQGFIDGGRLTGPRGRPPGDRLPLKASIVVCTRERPGLLATCLQALAPHAAAGCQVIVVDNAPITDAAARLVSQYPYRYILEAEPGLNRARNRGLEAATGDVVAFTDDDCLPDPGWVAALTAAYQDPRVGGVTGLVMPYELETPAQRRFEAYCSNRRIFHERIFQSPQWPPSRAGAVGMGANMSFRRSLLESLGGFDIRFDGGTPALSGGDTEMFARLLDKGYKLVYRPDALVLHRHPRREASLRRVIFGYGVGLYAFLAKRLVEDRDGSVLLTALRWLAGPPVKALWNRVTGRPGAPLDLVFYEFWGSLHGPLRYFRVTDQTKGKGHSGMLDGSAPISSRRETSNW